MHFHGTCYLNFDRSRRITKRPVKIDGTGALLSSNQTWVVASRWRWLKMRNKPYCRFPHVTNRNWSKMGSCHKKIALPFLEWKKAVPAWLENLLHCIVCGPFNEETGCSFTGINSSNVLQNGTLECLAHQFVKQCSKSAFIFLSLIWNAK